MSQRIVDIVRANRAGSGDGVVSVCSANRFVLEAAARECVSSGATLLVEATSNQVNQDGGYTGMRPAQFVDTVRRITGAAGVPPERVVLGGDHLGPHVWRGRPAAAAMTKATEMVEEYVSAGFTKIHVDCSMACADDTGVDQALVAERSALLVAAAERAADPASPPIYVIGTEVPVPGGSSGLHGLQPTRADDARATLHHHRAAFARSGAESAWERVVGLVVQPGVEFDQWSVVDYDRRHTAELQAVLSEHPSMAFEAHSTDYQTPQALADLVGDHWAILKVGPGLTFALREAVFALEQVEKALVPAGSCSNMADVLEQVMVEEPTWWASHYAGTPAEQALARRYSLSDRMRYYWPDPRVESALDRLIHNLDQAVIPLALLSQYLPRQYARVRTHELEPGPRDLVLDHIRDVLRDYTFATTLDPLDRRETHAID